MKSTCINHPPKEPLILIRQWQVKFCEGNRVGAALLSFFEYWHNIRLEQSGKSAEANQIAQSHGCEPSQDDSLLQFHTEAELEAGIMIAHKDKIRLALQVLVNKGAITIKRNPNPRYKFDNTRYFLFHPDVINEWLAKTADDIAKTPDNRKVSSEQSRKFAHASTENPRRSTENPRRSTKSPPPSTKNQGTITETTSETTKGNNLIPHTGKPKVFPKMTIELLDHISVEQLCTYLENVFVVSFPTVPVFPISPKDISTGEKLFNELGLLRYSATDEERQVVADRLNSLVALFVESCSSAMVLNANLLTIQEFRRHCKRVLKPEPPAAISCAAIPDSEPCSSLF